MHHTIAEAVRDTIQAMIWPPEETVIRKELARLEHDPAELCMCPSKASNAKQAMRSAGRSFVNTTCELRWCVHRRWNYKPTC
jgi:hypothetical protein